MRHRNRRYFISETFNTDIFPFPSTPTGILTFDLKPEFGSVVPGARQGERGVVDGVGG